MPAEKFLEAVGNQQNIIVAMSALLTTTMGYMREVIKALENAGIRDRVKVTIGGAPITQPGLPTKSAARRHYSENASGAVVLARKLLGHGLQMGSPKNRTKCQDAGCPRGFPSSLVQSPSPRSFRRRGGYHFAAAEDRFD